MPITYAFERNVVLLLLYPFGFSECFPPEYLVTFLSVLDLLPVEVVSWAHL